MDYDARREEEHKRNREVREKLVKAAAILKMAVEPVESEDDKSYSDCRVACKKAGAALWMRFSAGYGDKRIHVSGDYPRHSDGSYAALPIYYSSEERAARENAGLPIGEYGKVIMPSITISPDKAPEVIARDIEQRILADVIDYTARVQATIDATNDYESRTAATIAALNGTEPGKLDEYEKKNHETRGYFEKIEGQEYTGRWCAKVSRDSVDLELHNLTLAQARAAIDAVKAIK